MNDGGLTILAVDRRGDGLRAKVAVEAGGRWFDGHFPGSPVLPAIAHFDLLCRVHRAGGGSGRVAALDRVRLTSPVRPGDRLELELAPRSSTSPVPPATAPAWKFTLRTADGRVVSDGVMRWAAAPGAAA